MATPADHAAPMPMANVGRPRDLTRNATAHRRTLMAVSKAFYERPLTEADPHRVGPGKVDGKYFAFTGNTHYGVQNLEYDPYLERWWMGVYQGTKPQYPNYLMFAVDAKDRPRYQSPTGLDGEKGLILPLAQDGLLDEATGIRGWNRDASVGIQSLDNGLYYLAEQTKIDGQQASEITLETCTGDAENPFVPVTEDFEYPWQPGAVYTEGDETRFAGSAWRAAWWTQNQRPGDENGPWQEIISTDDGTAVWTPTRIFTAGEVVEHDGTTWTAKWWTRNQEPGDPPGAGSTTEGMRWSPSPPPGSTTHTCSTWTGRSTSEMTSSRGRGA